MYRNQRSKTRKKREATRLIIIIVGHNYRLTITPLGFLPEKILRKSSVLLEIP